jgi:hypothetical protein
VAKAEGGKRQKGAFAAFCVPPSAFWVYSAPVCGSRKPLVLSLARAWVFFLLTTAGYLWCKMVDSLIL